MPLSNHQTNTSLITGDNVLGTDTR